MRLSLSVNDKPVVLASLEANGWLSAHVNLSQGIDSDEPPNRVWLVAYDKSEEPKLRHVNLGRSPLYVGDRVELRVLPDGESDAPTGVTRTAEATTNLFTDVEQARLLLTAIQVCDRELMGVLEQAQDVEPQEELTKIQRAIADIIVEMDRQLISPTLRKHPELLAEAKEKNLR